MKRINSIYFLSSLMAGGLLLTACNGDDTTATSDTDSTSSGGDDGMTAPTTMMMTTVMADSSSDGGESSSEGGESSSDGNDGESSSSDEGFIPVPVDVFVEITNISGSAVNFSPMSPGVWLNHEQGGELLYAEDVVDPGLGLEDLAEDGDPAALAAAIANNAGALLSGVFDTPEGAGAPGPLLPGESYRVEFTAEPFSRLSLAFMLVGSNDWFIGSAGPGIGLFAGGGQPQGVRDVTSLLRVWDSGTEGNQAPSQGPWQALHGGSPNIGTGEVDPGVYPVNDSTRAIPLPIDLISLEVDQGDGVDTDEDEYTFTFTNISYTRGTLVTPLSDFWYMAHDDTVSMFTDGAAATAGIEALAEDGIATGLETAFNGAAGVATTATVAGPFAPGDAGGPGDTITFTVNVDNTTPILSFATMVVESNDAFLALPPIGVSLYDEDGDPRDDEDIEDDILRLLTVWDAGTEINEVPGAGGNQVLRQAAPNTGAADADTNVRIYQDEGNDLEGAFVGGMMDVTILNDAGNPGDFIVRITNTSDTTRYPAAFTPAFYMLHDSTVVMLETGELASPGLESLAEDGSPVGLVGEWAGMGGVLLADSYNQPENLAGDILPVGPLAPGEWYEFTVTPVTANRFFSFASMVVPSNDTFAAFGSPGVALLSAAGAPRTDMAIATDIAAELAGWDAGTEGNQAGAGGRDQAPRQSGPNVGQGTGSGLVRVHEDGPTNVLIWSAPQPNQVVQVRVGPV